MTVLELPRLRSPVTERPPRVAEAEKRREQAKIRADASRQAILRALSNDSAQYLEEVQQEGGQ